MSHQTRERGREEERKRGREEERKRGRRGRERESESARKLDFVFVQRARRIWVGSLHVPPRGDRGAQATRHTSSNVLCIVPLHSKFTSTLTVENV